eukprot:c19121_g1_i1 orf=485-1117(-)
MLETMVLYDGRSTKPPVNLKKRGCCFTAIDFGVGGGGGGGGLIPAMKHGRTMRKLNRTAEHRWALMRNMVTQLIKHERIETTLPKAKELRKVADQMVTMGKEGTLVARRRAVAVLRGDFELHKLFTELAERYKDRAGGYTRVLRTRIRQGDAAEMAYIEFVDRPNELRPAKPPQTPPLERPPLAPWIKSRMVKHWACGSASSTVTQLGST